MGPSQKNWVPTNLRTLAVTAMVVFILNGHVFAQQSASGCGILSEIDAMAVPAWDIDSQIVVEAIAAPFGLTELSRATFAIGLPHLPVSMWLSGRSASGWSDVTLGGRSTWSPGPGFHFGLRTTIGWTILRGFSNTLDVRLGLSALVRRDEWTFGASIDDIVVVGSQPVPWVRCAAMYAFELYNIAVDVVMNSESEVALLFSGVWMPTNDVTLVAGLLTSPLTIRLDARISTFDAIELVLGIKHVENLGMSPHVVATLPW